MLLNHEAALAARTDLKKYGPNAHLLFALEMAFHIEDIHAVASDSLTDGFYDKKCDLIYLNPDEDILVVAQGYFSEKQRASAPSNKASDLNTACAWLFCTPLDQIPHQLRSAAALVHSALEAGTIRTVRFWYVHNLPESANVREELDRVESVVAAAIKRHFSDALVTDIRAEEVGGTKMEELYNSLSSPILIADEQEVELTGGFTEAGGTWEAFVTSLDGVWLYDLYRRHKSNLFSANLRGYLGSRRTDKNINHGIRQTAESDPSNFWAFNNGITVLVHDFRYDAGTRRLWMKGFSVVNGAQTSGAIGSLPKPPAGVKVLSRVVKCSDAATIQSIINYNNSQNPLLSPDFRSNDAVQRRLRAEFAGLQLAEYTGGRRDEGSAPKRRNAHLLPSDTVAQALAAVHGEAQIAYHEKSKIWTSDSLYSRFFNERTTATHIVWCYSLLKSIENKKLGLVSREAASNDLPNSQQQVLDFLRRRGAIILLATAIAACTETILDRRIANLFDVSFGEGVAPASAESLWSPIVEVAAPLAPRALAASLTRGIDHGEVTVKCVQNFAAAFASTAPTNRAILDIYAAAVDVRR